MKKTVALFDFDGTLYKKDSLIEITKFSKGKIKFYIGIIALLPYLIGLKLKIIPNEKAKQKFIGYFFKNMELDKFNSICSEFAMQKIEPDLDTKIFAKFENHINSNHLVYIVTASIPEWIEPWSNRFGVTVIGTKIEVLNNRLTGRFSSKNCFGIEKANRIKELINLHEFDAIYVYGSGKGDLEMLKLSKKN